MTDLRDLSARIEALPPGGGGGGTPAEEETKRDLFFELARIRIDAESSGDAATVGLADELRRDRLRLRPSPPGPAARLVMAVRLVLTALVASWGCLVLVAASPLRLTHPILRKCGVRNGLLPVDLLGLLWSHTVLRAAGVRVIVDGRSARAMWRDEPYGIVVYNHSSNLDPFIVMAACAGSRAPKFVGKKVLFSLPVFGWFAAATGQVPINRGDPKKSIATMNDKVASIMKKWGRSVAVSPEGTRTKDGHLLLPFKKGAFHLSRRTQAPLLPMVVHGAFDLWPPGAFSGRTGAVTVRLLGAQRPPPPAAPDSDGDGDGNVGHSATDEARLKLQRAYLEELSSRPGGRSPLSLEQHVGDAIWNLATLLVYGYIGTWIRTLLATSGAGGGSIMALIGGVTFATSFFVHHFL